MTTRSEPNGRVVILGIYVTDLTFRAERMPLIGETIAGSAFAMGPGGKGSNQAIAISRLGGDVTFLARIGDDIFGTEALKLFDREGIDERRECQAHFARSYLEAGYQLDEAKFLSTFHCVE